MSSGWLIFLIAVGVVAFFVVGMSLTIIFKGHYMESEIGENRHMKARGIRCASQQLREEEAALRGDSSADDGACSGGSCSSCMSPPATDPIGAVPGRASPCPVRFGNRSAPSVAFLSFRRPFLEEGGKLPPGRFRTCTGIRFL